MFAILILSGLLSGAKAVVVKAPVAVAKATRRCPVTRVVEDGIVRVGEKIVNIITFGSYGK